MTSQLLSTATKWLVVTVVSPQLCRHEDCCKFYKNEDKKTTMKKKVKVSKLVLDGILEP